jgi:predicted acyltransferase
MSEHAAPPPQPSARIVSLDAFRGITIAVMLLVNNPGSWSTLYSPLAHATWEGCTLADLVFPFFLFAVGASLAISLPKARARLETNLLALRGSTSGAVAALVRRVLLRGLILFALGLFLNLFPLLLQQVFGGGNADFSTLRILGVLQRIGLTFVVAGCIWLFLPFSAQYLLGALLLAGYSLLLGPRPVHPTDNLIAHLDAYILPAANMYRGGPLDPEGLTSTLPAIVSVLLGAWITRSIRASPPSGSPMTPFARLAGVGVILMLGGGLLSIIQPVIKPLWTPAYVLLTAGLACWVWSVLSLLTDTIGLTLRPLVVFGSNALFAFFATGVVGRLLGFITVNTGEGPRTLGSLLYAPFTQMFANPYNASLAYALATVLVWYGVHEVLYRARIFWKI